MKAEDFIYQQIFKAVINGSCATQSQAQTEAQEGIRMYRQGRYKGRVSKLIDDTVKQSVKKYGE